MANVNRVILIGRLTKDPEIKYTANQTPVCSTSIATNKVWMKDGTKQEKTEFHNIVIWGKMAETFNQYMSKGKECYVEGELATRSWDDKQGNKRYTTEVNVNHFQFISGNADKNAGLKKAETKQQEYQINTNASFAAEDIPF